MILFTRRVYPEAIFERKVAHGLAVRMSRHPELNEAIASMLHHAQPLLAENAVRTIALVIMREDDMSPLEQYSFEVDLAAPTDVPATFHDVDELFNAALVQIATLEVTMPPLPTVNVTFTILVQALHDAPAVRTALSPGGHPLLHDSEGNYWTRVDANDPEATLTPMGTPSLPDSIRRRPLKSMQAGRMRLNVAVSTTSPSQ